MSLQCPRCHSPKVASFHHAMKVGAAIGIVGGVARGVSAAMAGGQAGAAIGALAGPVGITLASVSGAILGGLATSWPTTSVCSAVIASICRPDRHPHHSHFYPSVGAALCAALYADLHP